MESYRIKFHRIRLLLTDLPPLFRSESGCSSFVQEKEDTEGKRNEVAFVYFRFVLRFLIATDEYLADLSGS